MSIKRLSLRAFTLLESLVALVVISGGLLLFQGMSQYVSRQVTSLSHSQQEDWLLFAQHLRSELAGSRLDKVEDNKLYLTKGRQDLAIGLSKSGDIRKTNGQGQGYQPMLFNVETFQVQQAGQRVTISLQLKGGQERSFVYDFS